MKLPTKEDIAKHIELRKEREDRVKQLKEEAYRFEQVFLHEKYGKDEAFEERIKQLANRDDYESIRECALLAIDRAVRLGKSWARIKHGIFAEENQMKNDSFRKVFNELCDNGFVMLPYQSSTRMGNVGEGFYDFERGTEINW
jgi:hypothetical protein